MTQETYADFAQEVYARIYELLKAAQSSGHCSLNIDTPPSYP